MNVYLGRQREEQNVNEKITERTVIDLIAGYENCGYHLYMENFFSSLQLYRRLKDVGILACGTARSNRAGMPAEFTRNRRKQLGLTRHRLACRTTLDGISCILFNDKRMVTLLSSIHGPAEEGKYSVTIHGTENVVRPVMIVDYNNYMGAVDQSYLLSSSYYLHRRMTKWTKKLFFHIFDMLLVNAYTAYNK